MADELKRKLTAIGDFVGLYSFIAKVVNVNNGGTIALSGDWAGLPDEEKFTYGRMVERKEVKNKTGSISKIVTTLTGYELKSTFNQRNAIAQEFDATYAGFECVMLIQLHRFKELSPVEQQWLAIFGTPSLSDQKRESADGKVEFTFTGMTNAQAVVLTTTPASGKVTCPTGIAGFTGPASDITIPAYDGTNGIYKLVDIAVS
jgi:hypothetical protein